MAEQRSARLDVAENTALPADIRSMNFYMLLESLYRRYGEPGQEPSCVPSRKTRWCYLNPTPALPFRAVT